MNIQPDKRRVVVLDNPRLPIACPNESTPADLLHPRVYLALSDEGMTICPYCGTVYRLREVPAKGKKE